MHVLESTSSKKCRAKFIVSESNRFNKTGILLNIWLWYDISNILKEKEKYAQWTSEVIKII